MFRITALLLLALAGYCVWRGREEAASVSGRMDAGLARLGQAWDGEPRLPDSKRWYIASAVCAVAGAALLLRRTKRAG